MRFRVWGLKRLSLMMISCVPLMMLFLFHSSFQRNTWFWILPFYFLWTSIWIYFLRRGFFSIRFGFYSMNFAWITFELCDALFHRNLERSGGALLAFIGLVLVSRWLEVRVVSAPMNAMIHWYEGDPKALPQVMAKIEWRGESFFAQVRRVDEKGLFVILNDARIESFSDLLPFETVSFELHFGKLSSDGEAKVVSGFFAEKIGLGLQFLPKDLYHFSQYTGLVESLRGEGYAS